MIDNEIRAAAEMWQTLDSLAKSVARIKELNMYFPDLPMGSAFWMAVRAETDRLYAELKVKDDK